MTTLPRVVFPFLEAHVDNPQETELKKPKAHFWICDCGCRGYLCPAEEKNPPEFHSKVAGLWYIRELLAHKILTANAAEIYMEKVRNSNLPETSPKDSPRWKPPRMLSQWLHPQHDQP